MANFVFDSLESADMAFTEACSAATSALLADKRGKALTEATDILGKVSWPKSTLANVAKVLEVASVTDTETGEKNQTFLVWTLDSDGNVAATVTGSAPRSANNGGTGGTKKVSDYLLDGKPLSNPLLLTAEYADTVAGKVARNKYRPFGVTKTLSGKEYSETTAWNALHACQHDPVLKSRLTLKSA